MSYRDFLEMYARDVKTDPETLLAQKPLSFPVSTNERGEALVSLLQRTTELELGGKRVLDVGCAYGGLSIALARAGANVSAVDVNPKFIGYAGELDAALGRREDLVWYDMGVGVRCYRLAYLLDVAARDGRYADEDVELMARALYFHNEALSRDSLFRSHNNHGVYQALGQLACSRRFEQLPKMGDYDRLAARRLETLCKDHFFESGVHKEHSPGYHYMVLNSLIGARNAGLLPGTSCADLLRRAELALMWMIMPDGRVCPIGDSDPRSVRLNNPADVIYEDPQLAHVISAGSIGEPPPAAVQSYQDAGYVFARLPSRPGQPPEQWSYLAQIAGFHSRTHKHADHLSFVWFERGQEVLVDAGRYGYLGRTEPRSALAKQGYWYSNPNACSSNRRVLTTRSRSTDATCHAWAWSPSGQPLSKPPNATGWS